MVLVEKYSQDEQILRSIKHNLSIFDKLFKNAQDGIIITDPLGLVEDINPAFVEMTGFNAEEFIGFNNPFFMSKIHNKDILKEIEENLNKVGFWKGELFIEKKNKEVLTLLVCIESILEDQKVKNLLFICKDISQIKEYKNELIRLEKYDYLTNLPNRKMLLDDLEIKIKEAEKLNSKIAVIFLDVDNFKNINDKFGHNFGDLLLLEISKDLKRFNKIGDVLSRIGGDEFVLIARFTEDGKLKELIDKLLKEFSNKVYDISNNQVEISVSMGIAVYPNIKSSPDELMRSADQAMYKAKQQGRKRFIFFDEKQEEESVEHYKKVDELNEALKNSELKLWYQPKVLAKNNQVVGFESLIRWIKPDGRIVPAADFIDVIYGEELDYKIGYFVIEEALKDQAKWRKNGHYLDLSINISPDHLLHENFKNDLISLIDKYNTVPSTITLEILETSKIENFNLVIEKMQECTKIGVHFSLDDFGTGYSSLSYLRSIPTKEVKIDKSFVLSILNNKEDQLIISGIVGLSHALNRVVVAEGVETTEHMEILKTLGVDILQGYGISRPMPEEKLINWIDSWKKNII